MRLLDNASRPMRDEQPPPVSSHVGVHIFESEATRDRGTRIDRWWEAARIEPAEDQPHVTVNLHDLHADIAPEVVTGHLLRPIHPDSLVVLGLFTMGKGKVFTEGTLEEIRASIDDRLLKKLIQLSKL